jgi:GNAT superfamily N-acetyltransferase
MLPHQITEIRKRIEETGIGLKDALAVIHLAAWDPTHPMQTLYGLFSGLNGLIDRTVHGTTIERVAPEKDDRKPFHTLEILTDDGEVLGYLNMVYRKALMPWYYLVYVEVMPPFRGLGLGQKIIEAFMQFVDRKRAVGLLDNIIPPDEPTYEIYSRLGWKKVNQLLADPVVARSENYMVFAPGISESPELRKDLVRILFGLTKKRSLMDMHDNEDMVKRTIGEFRSVYRALTQIFEEEIARGGSTPLMCFMFTRLATRFIGFKRRISALIGYTGGESLDQISFSDEMLRLPIQPYSLWSIKTGDVGTWGERELMRRLPAPLMEEPTFFIEALPFYKRPYLSYWLERLDPLQPPHLTIGDLFRLGLDPTRLRQFSFEGRDYVFERIAPHFLQALLKKRRFLRTVESMLPSLRFCGAAVRANPPVLILRDRGNVYALRRKLEGVHSQEALDQLRTARSLREMNRALRIDAAQIRTIDEIRNSLAREFNSLWRQEVEDLTYFVPWDIEKNRPRLRVDVSGISFETIWIA